MENNIFEEIKLQNSSSLGTSAASIEKKARQLVYDARYEVNKITKGTKTDNETKLRMVLQRIRKSNAIPAVKVRAQQIISKKPTVSEDFFEIMEESATLNIVKAMYKVFVEKVENLVHENEDYLQELNNISERKYKVRVTDKKTGNSYVRYATREKITKLRSNPNIQSVEMTEYGTPRSEVKKDIPNNKYGLDKPTDPSKRDGDVNDDGKKDSTDSYIYNRRDIINKAISKRKEQTEEFILDEKKSEKITGKNVDNYKGTVVINPEIEVQNGKTKKIYAHTEIEGEIISENAYSKFLRILNEKSESQNQQKLFGLALSVKRGKTPRSEVSQEVLDIVDKMSEKEIRKYAKTPHKGLPEKKEEMKEEMAEVCPRCAKCSCECDKRSSKTYRDVLKNKLRAMGLKNPMVLNQPEDEKVMDLMTSSKLKNEQNAFNPWQYNFDLIRKGKTKRKKPLDTRTDAQKMYDATSPRPGSNFRGD